MIITCSNSKKITLIILSITLLILVNAFAQETAQEALKKAKGYFWYNDYEQAIISCTKAIELNPNYVEAYNNRGFAYYNKGDYEKAISDYTKALELYSGDAKLKAKVYSNRGAAYLGKGKYDETIADCSSAISLNPSYANAYSNRGAAYLGKGNYDQAILDCTKALELEPNHIEAHCYRAKAYFSKQEYDKAWDDVHKVKLGYKLDPQFLEALKKVSGREN